jgi:hypothetical protein
MEVAKVRWIANPVAWLSRRSPLPPPLPAYANEPEQLESVVSVYMAEVGVALQQAAPAKLNSLPWLPFVALGRERRC